MVLGVQWLSTLGPILWDFLNLRMKFTFRGLKHILRGLTPNVSKVISGSSLNKLMLHNPDIALLHLRDLNDSVLPQQPLTLDTILYHIEASKPGADDDGALQRLLDSYSDIFSEPSSLASIIRYPSKQAPGDADARNYSI